jgi:hypothetical protein
MKDDYTKSKGYERGWKWGAWFYRNQVINVQNKDEPVIKKDK